MNSKSIGEIAEAAILNKLISPGWSVSIPFGNNQRYDMILDRGQGLERIQCKSSRIKDGYIEFNSQSQNGFTRKRSSYQGQIE